MLPSNEKSYDVWPSAFKVIERPLYRVNDYSNQSFQNSTRLSAQERESYHARAEDGVRWALKDLRNLKFLEAANDCKYAISNEITVLRKKDYSFEIEIFLSILATPIVVIGTPFTIVIDIVAGVAQSVLRACQGADLKEIKSILHKKVIASPIQQGVFLAINLFAIACFGIIGAGYPLPVLTGLGIALILGLQNYRTVQKTVGALPNWAHPDDFTVFIDGGALDHLGDKLIDFEKRPPKPPKPPKPKEEVKVEDSPKNIKDYFFREFGKSVIRIWFDTEFSSSQLEEEWDKKKIKLEKKLNEKYPEREGMNSRKLDKRFLFGKYREWHIYNKSFHFLFRLDESDEPSTSDEPSSPVELNISDKLNRLDAIINEHWTTFNMIFAAQQRRLLREQSQP